MEHAGKSYFEFITWKKDHVVGAGKEVVAQVLKSKTDYWQTDWAQVMALIQDAADPFTGGRVRFQDSRNRVLASFQASRIQAMHDATGETVYSATEPRIKIESGYLQSIFESSTLEWQIHSQLEALYTILDEAVDEFALERDESRSSLTLTFPKTVYAKDISSVPVVLFEQP